MAPTQPKEPIVGKSRTKPKDTNRVLKPSKLETDRASYDAQAVEARRAKDAHIVDKMAENGQRHQKLFEQGPNGPPVYDTQGFELDYKKVKRDGHKMPKQRRRTKAYKEMLEKAKSDRITIENIMGLSERGSFGLVGYKARDRVARDLGVPYHKVDVHHHEHWKEQGFKADPEEFKLESISEEEKQRLLELACGSALRK